MPLGVVVNADRTDLFISYAKADTQLAHRVENELLARGLTVWRDDALERNENFAVQLVDAIFRSAAVVVLWSENSSRRPWVEDEALLGYSLNRYIGVFLDDDVHEKLLPPYNQLQSTVLSERLSAAERADAIAGIVEDVQEARTRTPIYLRQRPPAKHERARGLDAFLHAALSAKFCFEAYDGDADRGSNTRFLAAIRELGDWADERVQDAVARFGSGGSPGEALWALYEIANAIDQAALWKAVSRAVRPFSILMSLACLKRAGATSAEIDSEYFPLKPESLIIQRRQAVPVLPKRLAAEPPAHSPSKQPIPARPAVIEERAPPSAVDGAKVSRVPVWPLSWKQWLVSIAGAFAVLLLAWWGLGRGNPEGDVQTPSGNGTIDAGPIGASTPREYTVVAGDTCWSIAQQHTGSGQRCDELQTINPELSLQGWHSVIHPGDVLGIPADWPVPAR